MCLAFITFFSVCVTNANNQPCQNGSITGTLAQGNCSCACDNGWEGDACETESGKLYF